jgi:hypothetical protein
VLAIQCCNTPVLQVLHKQGKEQVQMIHEQGWLPSFTSKDEEIIMSECINQSLHNRDLLLLILESLLVSVLNRKLFPFFYLSLLSQNAFTEIGLIPCNNEF